MAKKQESYLDVKSLDHILSIINTDMDEQEKANQLYKFCSYKSIIDNFNYRNYINNESRETIRLIEIKKVYDDYKKKGYFNLFKESYRCSTEEIEIRIEKLNKIYEIINSNISEYNKAYLLYSIYKDSYAFKKNYTLFIKYGEGDIRLEEGKEALDNFNTLYNKYLELETNGIMDNIKYLEKNNAYFINYEYAKFVIINYINSDYSYKENLFLKNLGIDKEIFNFCIKTIEELELELYNQYLNKKKENNKIRFYKNIEVIKDLTKGINTGYLEDGTEFNILVFIKKIPFKNNENFIKIITEFMKSAKVSQNETTTILDYIYSNKLHLSNTFQELETKKLYIIKNEIIKKDLTKEEIHKIIKYLKLKKLPVINQSFEYIKNKYLKKELDIDKELKELINISNQKEYTKTLIPKITK